MTKDGDLFSAGDNAYGQLGTGGTTDRAMLAKNFNAWARCNSWRCFLSNCWLSRWKPDRPICAANYGSCYAVDTSGRLFVWGYNGSGKLGIGNSTNQSYPVHASGVSTAVKSVSAGMQVAYAIDANGNLFRTGDNQNGQCGKVMQRQAGLTQAKTMLGRFFVQTVITPVQLDMDGLCI